MSLRNRPELMRWFRQNKPLTLKEQIEFMKSKLGQEYNGQIIYLNNKRVGVGTVKLTGELCLVLPDNYKLYRRDIIQKLIEGKKLVWGEVFHGNSISWDLEMCGFIPVHTTYIYESSNHAA